MVLPCCRVAAATRCRHPAIRDSLRSREPGSRELEQAI